MLANMQFLWLYELFGVWVVKWLYGFRSLITAVIGNIWTVRFGLGYFFCNKMALKASITIVKMLFTTKHRYATAFFT